MIITEGKDYREFDLFADYKPHEKQQAFHRSTARIKCCAAGVRGGKTYAGAREFIRKGYTDRAEKKGRLNYWVVAPTYTLTDAAKEEILDILGQIENPKQPIIKRELMKAKMLKGNIYIDPNQQRNQKHRARGLDGVWMMSGKMAACLGNLEQG